MSKTVALPYIEVKESVQPTDLGEQLNLYKHLQLPTGERFVVAVIPGAKFFGEQKWICDVFEVTNGKFDTSKPLWCFMNRIGEDLAKAQLVYYRMIQRLQRNELVEVAMTEQGLQCSDGQIM